MSRALVCSANKEYRSACGIACEACRFLIGERRREKTGVFRWNERERRSLTNLLPLPALEYAGVPAAAIPSGRDEAGPWQPLAWLIAFNLLDCLFTARALSLGYGEGNPVMAAMIEVNLPLALLFKSLLVGLGAWFLWRMRHMKLAARGLTVLAMAYGLLVIYHVAFQISAL